MGGPAPSLHRESTDSLIAQVYTWSCDCYANLCHVQPPLGNYVMDKVTWYKAMVQRLYSVGTKASTESNRHSTNSKSNVHKIEGDSCKSHSDCFSQC